MMKKVVGAFAAFLYTTSALGATLLPNGQQQFVDANGKPYAAGKVWFYSNFPTCSVLKNTWQDSANTILNTNPVTLDSAGRATIFGSGAYCQVLKDSIGNTIWTKYTADTSSAAGVSWGGTSGGTANAQTLSSSSFTGVDGQTIYFLAGLSNTSATTLTISGTTAAIVRPSPNGAVFLTGGEIVAGNVIGVTYVSSTGQFQLVTNNAEEFSTQANIAAASTVNLNSVTSHVANVTGSGATITSFGSGGSSATANSIFFVKFAGANTLTYNATSMITPTGRDIVINAGDSFIVTYLGGSNWQVLGVMPANRLSLVNAQTGTSYAVTSADINKLVTVSNAAAVAVSLPQATGTFGAGTQFSIQNLGTSIATLTPTTSTINGAASIQLPSGRGLTIVSDGTNWQINGTIENVWQTGAVSLSGTTTTITTAIPSWAKQVTISFRDLTISPAGYLKIRLGTSGGVTSSGYAGVGIRINNAPGVDANTATDGFVVNANNNTVCHGNVILAQTVANSWVESHSGGCDTSNGLTGGGRVTLSGALSSITFVTSLNNFTAGSVNVMYQ